MSAPDVCPVCGQKSSRSLGNVTTTRPFEVVRCSACSLVYVTPRPTPEELTAFYSADYFDGPGKRYHDYQGEAEPNARHMWSVLNGWYDLAESPNRTLLDVGTATAGFLDEARRDGWQVEGVELSDSAAAIGRQRGISVHTGDLDHEALGNDYGLVTMWHVVEHLPDPCTALAAAVARMAPGGLLLIELPNWNSVGRIVRRMDWSALTPPEHINFFTPETLTRFVRRAGLDVLRVQTPPHRFPLQRQPQQAAMNLASIALAGLGYGGYVRLMARRPRTAS